MIFLGPGALLWSAYCPLINSPYDCQPMPYMYVKISHYENYVALPVVSMKE